MKAKLLLVGLVSLLCGLLLRGQVQVITLDGSKSFDPEGLTLTYKWEQIGTSPMVVVIANPTSAITQVAPPSGQQWKVGPYLFKLTVTDPGGATGVDTIKVTVNPNPDKPPVVNAGVDLSTQLPKDSVNLQGAATDPDGTISLFQWTTLSGPNTPVIVTPGAAVTKVKGLIAGTYFFRLKATDNLGASAADTVKVTVTAANMTPQADAGPDMIITLPVTTVAIGGTDSPAGSQILWVKVSGPAGDIIKSPTSSFTEVANLSRGVFEYQKRVTAPDGSTAIDRVIVTVKKKCNWWQQIFGGCRS